MRIELPKAGKYVVAVSGGVDSVLLLHLLVKNTTRVISTAVDKSETPADLSTNARDNRKECQFVVAHYDHGIRADSFEDLKFVESLAEKYGLEFFGGQGSLGPDASEAVAREKRYEFLRDVQKQTNAQAIITAHHEDDRLETAILNMLRGTGRRGLSSLHSREGLLRPLLHVPKQDIITYAKENKLAWREDSTNAEEKYLRNYIRRQILPKFTETQRTQLLKIVETSQTQNQAIEQLLTDVLASHATLETFSRVWFVRLPHDVAREVLLAWLRRAGIRSLDRRQVERIVVLAKTLSRGKLVDVDAAYQLKIGEQNLALVRRER